MAIYLWLNAVAYLFLAIYCTVRADASARGLGYTSLNSSGQSEYLVIYGGLQFGLALAFALMARSHDLHRVGIQFALCLYVPIVVYRVITVLRFWPVQSMTLGVAALEVVLLIAAIALWWNQR